MWYFIYFMCNPIASSLCSTKHPPYIKIFIEKIIKKFMYKVFTFFSTLFTHLLVIIDGISYNFTVQLVHGLVIIIYLINFQVFDLSSYSFLPYMYGLLAFCHYTLCHCFVMDTWIARLASQQSVFRSYIY